MSRHTPKNFPGAPMAYAQPNEAQFRNVIRQELTRIDTELHRGDTYQSVEASKASFRHQFLLMGS